MVSTEWGAVHSIYDLFELRLIQKLVFICWRDLQNALQSE